MNLPQVPAVLAPERSRAYLVIVGLLMTGLCAWALLAGPVNRGAVVVQTYQIVVNEAEAAELQLLPGVGTVIAERIVSQRASGGVYRSIHDFEYRVKGIGPVTAGQVAPYLDFKITE